MSGSGVAAVTGFGSVGVPAPLAIAGCPVSLLRMEDFLGRGGGGAGTSAASAGTRAAACFFSKETEDGVAGEAWPEWLAGGSTTYAFALSEAWPEVIVCRWADDALPGSKEVSNTRARINAAQTTESATSPAAGPRAMARLPRSSRRPEISGNSILSSKSGKSSSLVATDRRTATEYAECGSSTTPKTVLLGSGTTGVICAELESFSIKDRSRWLKTCRERTRKWRNAHRRRRRCHRDGRR